MRQSPEEKRPGDQAKGTLLSGLGPLDSGLVSDKYWDAVETRAARVHFLLIE